MWFDGATCLKICPIIVHRIPIIRTEVRIVIQLQVVFRPTVRNRECFFEALDRRLGRVSQHSTGCLQDRW